jgi:hypothetical protein
MITIHSAIQYNTLVWYCNIKLTNLIKALYKLALLKSVKTRQLNTRNGPIVRILIIFFKEFKFFQFLIPLHKAGFSLLPDLAIVREW